MPLNQSPAAYASMRTYLDQALEADRGIRITCDSPGKAINLRQRLYKARAIDQKQNKELYPQGDPMHGVSAYDVLTVTVDGSHVLIKKVGAEVLQVEEL